MKLKKGFCIVFSFVFIALCFAGCSGQAPSQNMGAPEDYYGGVYDSMESSPAEAPDKEVSAAESNQKLVRTLTIEAETDDLDGVLAQLQQKVSVLGGYIENQSIRTSGARSGECRYAELTLRVPAAELDAFVEHINGASNVTYYQESAENITLQYVATDSRVKALEAERDRLMELMDKAENMSDLLQIEQRLTDVLSELERVASQLRTYDNMVDYGTVRLYISQVQEFTPTEQQSPWQRMGTGFMDSLKGVGNGIVEFFVGLVSASPYLVMLALLGTGALLIYKKSQKKKPKETKE